MMVVFCVTTNGEGLPIMLTVCRSTARSCVMLFVEPAALALAPVLVWLTVLNTPGVEPNVCEATVLAKADGVPLMVMTVLAPRPLVASSTAQVTLVPAPPGCVQAGVTVPGVAV